MNLAKFSYVAYWLQSFFRIFCPLNSYIFIFFFHLSVHLSKRCAFNLHKFVLMIYAKCSVYLTQKGRYARCTHMLLLFETLGRFMWNSSPSVYTVEMRRSKTSEMNTLCSDAIWMKTEGTSARERESQRVYSVCIGAREELRFYWNVFNDIFRC